MNCPSNIFLVGLMGAGKTTVGRALARRLHLEFLDCDQEIEARSGVPVRTIFEVEGEAGFRARESAMIEELSARQGIVLATGGGAVIDPANRRLLHERGITIYLRARVEDLYRRTRHDRERPLLQTADPLARLRELLTVRQPFYEEVAHLILDTGEQGVPRLVNRIERELEQLRGAPVP
ncbi:MAG: shikimate kinase [Pseudomonadota bacterium]|nr:shikimate kinase [Pseudomonadota bacterium]